MHNATIASTCQTVSGSDSLHFSLLPPGCELGTVAVHPYASAIQSISPNPMTGSATITYSTVEEANVRIEIIDGLGRSVVCVVNTLLQPGVYHAAIDTRMLPNGMYAVRMSAGRFTGSKSLLMVR